MYVVFENQGYWSVSERFLTFHFDLNRVKDAVEEYVARNAPSAEFRRMTWGVYWLDAGSVPPLNPRTRVSVGEIRQRKKGVRVEWKDVNNRITAIPISLEQSFAYNLLAGDPMAVDVLKDILKG